MRRLRLVKGSSGEARAERGGEREERFRFPAEDVWEVSCDAMEFREDRRRPALGDERVVDVERRAVRPA